MESDSLRWSNRPRSRCSGDGPWGWRSNFPVSSNFNGTTSFPPTTRTTIRSATHSTTTIAWLTTSNPEYNYSARDERHRFNAFGYYAAPWGIELSPRFSAHSAQPTSIDGSNHSVLLANGTVVKRNTVRKDNAFTSFDFRVSKRWKITERFRLEGAVDTFNLFNSKNLKQPQNGNLLFNFDGSLTSGLGDPRQAQLGVKLLF